mgnify:CR=1 FL=1
MGWRRTRVLHLRVQSSLSPPPPTTLTPPPPPQDEPALELVPAAAGGWLVARLWDATTGWEAVGRLARLDMQVCAGEKAGGGGRGGAEAAHERRVQHNAMSDGLHALSVR